MALNLEPPPPPTLTLRQVARWWPLALILTVTFVAYAPSLTSPLYGDDYFYLVAAREMSFVDYVQAAFTPWGHEPLLPFTRDFWRPLAFSWFAVAEPVFGGEPLPYHLANLAAHLTSVALLFLVARRLDPRPAVAPLAATIFALYPGSFEAITWISSVNSAGLPFALAAWLAFLTATETPRAVRWRHATLSAALVAVGLMFRESAVALLPAMGLWYLLVQRRAHPGEPRTYLPILPFLAVGAAYILIRTRLFTEPFANPDIYAFDENWLERWWYYVENALLPFRDPVTGWRNPAQDVAGAILLCATGLAILRRRWDLAALLIGLLLSAVPYGGATLGVGQRYFYFSTPVLALALAIALTEVLERVPPFAGISPLSRSAGRGVGGEGLLAVLLLAGSLITISRINHWNDIGPERQQTWVEQLRADHPALPKGGTLYAANVPLILAVFGGANLEPTVRWYYPEIGGAIYYTQPARPVLGPDDRFFDPLASDTRAQP